MIINCAVMYMVPHFMAPAPPSAPRGIIAMGRCRRAFIRAFVSIVKDGHVFLFFAIEVASRHMSYYLFCMKQSKFWF